MLFSAMVIYNIVDCLDPPVTEDDHYLPTENIVKSLFLSFVLGAVVFISAVRLQRQTPKR
ncbi:hypothetical protein CQ022_21685 [Chryseobacterium culicis]|uniref:Uncharacterized protein n=2 Tax=Chryseobacterium culicis TaxID=680127 RepID=A0A2S9CIL4_CHRCI|nr:hypothetical protein CQ022_21685 [Chryseobacterium culicis]PRB87382.1 hypothetical protein CQ033_21690 [Chryseobacterium culicis]